MNESCTTSLQKQRFGKQILAGHLLNVFSKRYHRFSKKKRQTVTCLNILAKRKGLLPAQTTRHASAIKGKKPCSIY